MQFDQEEGAALSFDFEHYISSCCPIANISALELCINSSGHVYGALVLHLLEVYTLIKRFKVDLWKFQVNYPSFCLIYILNFRQSRWGLYETSMTNHTLTRQFSSRQEENAVRTAPVFS